MPFLDMIEATPDHLTGMAAGARAAMLASPPTRMAEVFDGPMAPRGLVPVYAVNEAPLLALVRDVKAGRTGAEERAALAALAEGMMAEGSDVALVACTELSLVTGAAEGAGLG